MKKIIVGLLLLSSIYCTSCANDSEKFLTEDLNYTIKQIDSETRSLKHLEKSGNKNIDDEIEATKNRITELEDRRIELMEKIKKIR